MVTDKNVTEKEQEAKPKVYVGLDVHKKKYAVSCATSLGVSKKWVMPAKPQDLARALKKEFPECEIRSVYEAGFSGFVLHRVLEQEGIMNIVVNPASVARSSGDKVKTDRKDATKLMEYYRAELLKGIRIPSLEEEQKRQLTRLRAQLVAKRIRVMNQVRKRLVHFGYFTDYAKVLRRADVESFIKDISEQELKWCLELQCRLWSFLEIELKAIMKRLKEQSEKCPYNQIYEQVPGIGTITARILANELGNMLQFKNEKQLFKFVGLTPTEYSSGEHIRRGHISRQGNPLIRKVLVESAWVAIRHDQSLRTAYSKLSFRVGPKRAIVAIARKLIGRVRAIFRKGEDYRLDPIVEKLAA